MSDSAANNTIDETVENLQVLADISFDSRKAATDVSQGINPFRVDKLQQNESVLKEIFGARCECGAERVSTCPPSTGNPQGGHKHGATNFEHSIINPTPFKHRIKGDRKVIIRESILKNIGKCVHQNVLKQTSIAKDLVKKQRFSNTFVPISTQLKPSLSENNLVKSFSNDASDDMLDFRLLVDQCSELTLSTGSAGKTADGTNFSHSSFKVLRQHNLPTFSNGRAAKAGISGVSRKAHRARQLKRCNSTSSLESDSSSNSGVQFGSPSGMPPQNMQQQPNPQQSPSASSPSSSSTASCSTQARLNSTMPCDITIDEMASYFETLVHIPKKMSSMAEMMYI